MLTGPSPPWEKTGQWTENFFNTQPADYTATTEYGAGCWQSPNKNRILTRAEMFQMIYNKVGKPLVANISVF